MNYDQKEDFMTDECKYKFMKSFIAVIDQIQTKELSNELINSIEEFKTKLNEFKKRNDFFLCKSSEILEDGLYHINYELSQSVYQDSSATLRKILLEVYNIDYSCPDFYLFDCNIPTKSFPKIFQDKVSGLDLNSKDLSQVKDEINKQAKETGSFFSSYTSSYPFDPKLSIEALEHIINKHKRIKPYEILFLWFPGYYQLYEHSMDILMKKDDFIPITWKYYIAIMGVSTIKSHYMLKDLETKFLLCGGDESWLIKGLSAVPSKLRNLKKLNNIIAHQPWKIKVKDLSELCNKYEHCGWNINELIQACLILTNFQRLATVVEAIGLKADPHKINDDSNESKMLKYNLTNDENSNVKKSIITELENINNNPDKRSGNRKYSEEKDKNKCLNSSFENIIKSLPSQFYKHITDFCTIYQDFDSHSDEYQSYIEFNWQDSGSYILQNFCPDGVMAINAEIEFICTLSSNNIGGDLKKLDTTYYRHTINTYVERIFGFVNESFDYSKTNKLLHRTHKQFIKNIACFPQKINKSDMNVLQITFSLEEIYHIILLVSLIKMRLQLTYFAKNIYEIIKSIE